MTTYAVLFAVMFTIGGLLGLLKRRNLTIRFAIYKRKSIEAQKQELERIYRRAR
jgi:NADH:ubiquinone oxidoreductase subunit K